MTPISFSFFGYSESLHPVTIYLENPQQTAAGNDTNSPSPQPPLGLIWTVILVWKYCVAFQQCILHSHNEHFFYVGLLVYWIWLWSRWAALSPPSTSVSSDFMVLSKCLFKIILTSLYLVEDLAWWDWPFTWWTDQLLSFSALTLLVGSSDP